MNCVSGHLVAKRRSLDSTVHSIRVIHANGETGIRRYGARLKKACVATNVDGRLIS